MLQTLVLINQSISGHVPHSMKALGTFVIEDSRHIGGTLPQEMPMMLTINWFTGLLSGTIPSTLFLSRGLVICWLANNALSGTLPRDYARENSLSSFSLGNNRISGPHSAYIT